MQSSIKKEKAVIDLTTTTKNHPLNLKNPVLCRTEPEIMNEMTNNAHSSKDTKVSLFIGGKTAVKPKETISFKDVADLLQSEKLQELTAKIIAAETDDEKQELKSKSRFITPYGTFPYRNNESIEQHNSNIAAFDFDKMNPEQVAKITEILKENKSCILCFTSPRQKGVKAVFLIGDTIPLNSHYDTLKASAAALLDAIGVSEYIKYLDYSQFVLSQPLYLSYAKERHYNPDAEPLKVKLITPQVTEPRTTPRAANDFIDAESIDSIDNYILGAAHNVVNSFDPLAARHPQIAKCKGPFGYLKQYPQNTVEDEVDELFYDAMGDLYGSDAEAKAGNAYKSLMDAKEKAEPKVIEAIEKTLSEKVDFNSKAFRDKFRVSATEEIQPPQIAWSSDGAILGTLGNFSLITGKAKAKKSFLISMAVSIALTDDVLHGGFKSSFPPDQNEVLYFDTEMSKYHVQLAVKRICQQINVPEPKNLHTFHLRSLPPAERLQFIEAEIYSNPNIGFVVIDGVKDLITSINDEDQASMIASKLLKWTEERNIHIVTVLHQNKGDNNARGHIGTELINKAETVLSVTVLEHDKDTSIVEPQQCRNREPEPFAFRIDENGLPYIVSDFETEKPKKENNEVFNAVELLQEVFSFGKEFSYSKLQTQLMIAYTRQTGKKLGKTASERLITSCENDGLIIQEVARGPHTLNPMHEIDSIL